jgi:transposase
MGGSGSARIGPVDLERRRMAAAGLFEQGVRPAAVGRLLGVSRQAAWKWHNAWVGGGADARVGSDARSNAYLTREQERALLVELKRGPQEHGWAGQGWTLARVARVIEEEFGPRYSVPGVWYLLKRLRWSWQVPVTRATQRDEEAIAAWRTETWPAVSHPERPLSRDDGSSSRTSPERP